MRLLRVGNLNLVNQELKRLQELRNRKLITISQLDGQRSTSLQQQQQVSQQRQQISQKQQQIVQLEQNLVQQQQQDMPTQNYMVLEVFQKNPKT